MGLRQHWELLNQLNQLNRLNQLNAPNIGPAPSRYQYRMQFVDVKDAVLIHDTMRAFWMLSTTTSTLHADGSGQWVCRPSFC